MVLQHIQRAAQLPHIKHIGIVVFVPCSQVKRLHWIPADGICAQSCYQLCHWRACAQVVEDERSVRAGRCKDGCLGLVELDDIDGVSAPIEGRDGLRAR